MVAPFDRGQRPFRLFFEITNTYIYTYIYIYYLSSSNKMDGNARQGYRSGIVAGARLTRLSESE